MINGNSKTGWLKSPSGITFSLLALVITICRISFPRYLTYDVLSILSWDVFGYYLYLPATSIHHDLALSDFSWVQQILDTYHPTNGFYQAYLGPAGHYVLKYPMGLAIVYAPFFFVGHLFSMMLGFPTDGFSLPYQVSVAMGCLLITVAGIWFLRKVLLNFFSEGVTMITMILIVLGTNYFELTAYDGALVHNALFTIYALIIWMTILWHKNPTWIFSLLLGLLIGLITIIRPTEIISAIIPLLWGVWNKRSLVEKWKLIHDNWEKVILILVALLLVGSFQLIYWKIYSGSWFYYSYEPNERLHWIAPWLWEVLFSFKKGWLIYTPMMFFALIGFIWLGRKYKPVFFSLFLFTVANILIVASWPTWWYGGSFGQRAMMQSYAVLAFPLAALIQWLVRRRMWIKGPLFALMIFFIVLNLFQTWQYINWIIEPSRMTKRYYMAIFGKTYLPERAKRYLEPLENFDRESLDDASEYNARQLFSSDFESAESGIGPKLQSEMALSGNQVFLMDSTKEFSPGIKIPLRELNAPEGSWIRTSLSFFPLTDMKVTPASLVITMSNKQGNFKYKAVHLNQDSVLPGAWNKLTMVYEIPYISDPDDQVAVYIWNNGKGSFYLDDFLIELLVPKEEE